MTAKDEFLALIGPEETADAALLEALQNQADHLIMGYLCRSDLPPGIDSARAMMMLVLFNRRGAEGESQRDEGEVRSVFEALPQTVCAMLRPHRRAFTLPCG